MTGYELLIGLEMLTAWSIVAASIPRGSYYLGPVGCLLWGFVDCAMIALLIANGLDSWQHAVLVAFYAGGAVICFHACAEGGKLSEYAPNERSKAAVMLLLLAVGMSALLVTG